MVGFQAGGSSPRMRHQTLPAATLVIALVALVPARGDALYVDPGAGSLVVQIVISAMLGVTFVFHRTITTGWRSVRNALSRLRHPRRVPTDADAGKGKLRSHPHGGTRS